MNDYIEQSVGVFPPLRSGWIETTLKSDSIDKIKSYINKSKEIKYNIKPTLAGNISSSFALVDEEDWFLKNVLRPCITQYGESFNALPEVKCILQSKQLFEFNADHFTLDGFWVNFQKQYEFNPMHTHIGLFSFVLWINIPVDWVQQFSLPITRDSGSPQAGDFKFTYMNMYGEFENYAYNAEKNLEGKLLLFPSKLNHSVNPFYGSEDFRVSVSGNLIIK